MKRETLLAVNTDLSGRGQAANTDYPENHSKKFNLHSQGQIQAYNLAMAGVQALKMSFETTVKIMLSHPSWKRTPSEYQGPERQDQKKKPKQTKTHKKPKPVLLDWGWESWLLEFPFICQQNLFGCIKIRKGSLVTRRASLFNTAFLKLRSQCLNSNILEAAKSHLQPRSLLQGGSKDF